MQKKTIMLWLFALQINRLKIDGGADGRVRGLSAKPCPLSKNRFSAHAGLLKMRCCKV
jgi:hypothetical protein